MNTKYKFLFKRLDQLWPPTENILGVESLNSSSKAQTTPKSNGTSVVHGDDSHGLPPSDTPPAPNNSNVPQLPIEQRSAPTGASARGNQQKAGIISWINRCIAHHNIVVTELGSDMSDGRVFFLLLEVITNKTLKGWHEKPTDMMMKLDNLGMFLKILGFFGIKISGISAEDIYGGNENIIMAILLLMIKKYTPAPEVPSEEHGEEKEQAKHQEETIADSNSQNASEYNSVQNSPANPSPFTGTALVAKPNHAPAVQDFDPSATPDIDSLLSKAEMAYERPESAPSNTNTNPPRVSQPSYPPNNNLYLAQQKALSTIPNRPKCPAPPMPKFPPHGQTCQNPTGSHSSDTMVSSNSSSTPPQNTPQSHPPATRPKAPGSAKLPTTAKIDVEPTRASPSSAKLPHSSLSSSDSTPYASNPKLSSSNQGNTVHSGQRDVTPPQSAPGSGKLPAGGVKAPSNNTSPAVVSNSPAGRRQPTPTSQPVGPKKMGMAPKMPTGPKTGSPMAGGQPKGSLPSQPRPPSRPLPSFNANTPKEEVNIVGMNSTNVNSNDSTLEMDFSAAVPGSKTANARTRASTISNINTNVFDLDAFSDMEDLLLGLADHM